MLDVPVLVNPDGYFGVRHEYLCGEVANAGAKRPSIQVYYQPNRR